MRVEYAHERRIREKNKKMYRVAHWPIWIWVFFLAPGPLTFAIFAGNPSVLNVLWLGVVLVGTGIAGLRGQLPGVEPKPYILRFTEDRPNPLYLAGLTIAVVTGTWYMKQIYEYAYFPLYAIVLILGALGKLPRVGPSTKGEGTERRYFYGTVWSVTLSQTLLMIFWKALPKSHSGDILKLAVYVAALLTCGIAASRGFFPRTRPIVAGEIMID
jgi:hypothetical protein